jgi:transposase
MRCSFSGLISRTKLIIKEDPLSGYLFVFFNKKRDYVKTLYWDESGYCIWKLPREEIIIEPQDSASCKSCGRNKIEISRKVTEKLCVVPAKYFVKRFVRPVYGCNCGNCAPQNAEAPYSALPKTVLDTSFLAQMLVQKFAWHLPFYRQSQMLKELELDISRDVLISAANKLGDVLTPIVIYMAMEIKACALVQIDESPINVASKNSHGKAQYNKNSYFWPILGGKQIVFTYTGNRKHCNVSNIIGDDFSGVLLSDGYQAYFEYCKSHPEASLALCWDHARRRFHDIKDKEPLALEGLEQIKVFYKVETEINKLLADEELTPDKVPRYRKEHTLPALNTFKQWCETVRDAPEVLPKDELMDACSYVINHWNGLTLYLEHGFIPISNIAVEQQIRNLKLGAKNWLFAASEAGAHTVAIMNSLVCTCKMNGINILQYVTDILGRLDSDSAKNLTPLAWAKEQEKK